MGTDGRTPSMVSLAPLMILAQITGHCACADATRVSLGPWSVPVGPVTVIFALTAAVFGPAVFASWLARRRRARAMDAVLRGASSR